MKVQSLFAAAMAVAGVNGAPSQLDSRQTSVSPFKVTGFTALSVVLSRRVVYHFDVVTEPGKAAAKCEYLGTSGNQELVSTPFTWCGTEASGVMFKWTVGNGANGASELVIVRVVERNRIEDQAVHLVPGSQLTIQGEGQFRHQVYTGPEDFSVPAFRVVEN